VCLGDEWETSSFLVKLASRPSDVQLAELKQDGVLSVEPLFKSFSGKEDLERQFGLDRWFVVNLKEDAALDDAILRTAALEQVAVVEYNMLATKASDCKVYPAVEQYPTRATADKFNDPMLMDQWHYNNQGSKAYSTNIAKGADINVKDVWSSLSCGDPGIIVAVVDEGVKYDHPDLKDNMWVNPGETPNNGIDDDNNGYVDDVYGYNFNANGPISWSERYYDEQRRQWVGDSGHGTHCAGTIAAVNNNNKGVAGVAGGSGSGDGCRIMSCQIFSGAGGGTAKTVSNAIKYAADMGASIISCSYGYSSAFSSDNAYKRAVGTAEIDAIHYFEASDNNPVLDGNIAIFAAGNENHGYAHYPGAFYDIISVSSFGPDYLPAYYTNYGPGCNIAAPGGEYYHGVGEKSMVLSTVPKEIYGEDYGYMQGTSMACPHVSGVVALALSYAKQQGKTFSRDEFKRMILASVSDIDQRIGATKEKSLSGYSAFSMAPYYHQMGTGAIDAWRLMMHIEGLPTLTSQIGREQWIDLSSAFGTASVSLTYLKVEVPESAVTSMGLQKVSPTNADKYPAVVDENGYAYVQFGRLYVHPTAIGSGKITITAVGGGDHVGGGNNPPGGMELTQSISLIAREADGGNGTGGWL
jgi:subtilisin family serine protease